MKKNYFDEPCKKGKMKIKESSFKIRESGFK